MAGLQLLTQPELPPFVDVNYGHPTPLLYATGFSLQMFGHSLTAIRLPYIIFGALSVGAFYLLLRLFFPVTIAAFGSLLMVYQYSHVILSRLAYEPIPALFWEIITMLFLVLYWKNKKSYQLLGLALSLGAGMYTYLAFRPFAAVVVFITIFLILRNHWKQNIHTVGVFIATICIAAIPLISFYFISPQSLSARATQISIFSQQYSSSEFAKELWGNMHRTAILPFFAIPNPDPDSPPVSGDPNPGHNPSSAAVFDLTTVILAIMGLIYLFRNNRFFFWVILLMLIPPYISDIFTTEKIPEGHYYGFGHPNVLRVSGFIWVVLFAATASFYWAYARWEKANKANVLTIVGIIALGLSFWNWYLYFNQSQISPSFYMFNYTFNHGRTVLTADYLNKTNAQKIHLSKDLYEDRYVEFFLRRPVQLSSFEVASKASVLNEIKNYDTTAIGVTPESISVLSEIQKDDITNLGYTINTINNPVGQPNIILFEKQAPLFLQPLQ